MKRSLILCCVLGACGSSEDSQPRDPNSVVAPESAPVKPKPMAIDPSLKPKFVKACEAATPGTPLGYVYESLADTTEKTSCSGRFDIIAKTRKATLGVTLYNSFEPLSYLPFVETLSISGPTSGGEEKIASLTNLQTLSISKSSFTDISFLKNSKYLTTLVVPSNSIKDASFLANNSNLRFFAIEDLSRTAGKANLPKDEVHCPVTSPSRPLNNGCKDYREAKK